MATAGPDVPSVGGFLSGKGLRPGQARKEYPYPPGRFKDGEKGERAAMRQVAVIKPMSFLKADGAKLSEVF